MENPALQGEFSIPKTARSKTPTFRSGISAVFVITFQKPVKPGIVCCGKASLYIYISFEGHPIKKAITPINIITPLNANKNLMPRNATIIPEII